MEQTVKGSTTGDGTQKRGHCKPRTLTVSKLLNVVIEHSLFECALVVGADGVCITIRGVFARTGDTE